MSEASPEALRQRARIFVEDWANAFPGPEPVWEQGVFQGLAASEKHNAHVGVLPHRCNSCEMLGSGCDDPIVRAWHGHTPYASLLVTHELMEKALAEKRAPNWIGV